MLEIDNLSVRYDNTKALEGVTLRVQAGEVVALLGPNGAGKTSLLNAVSRLTASGGEVRFAGLSLAGLKPYQVSRLGLIHVPEGRQVFPTLTVEENLIVGTTARAGRSGIAIGDVYDLFPPLKRLRKRAGWALSGGEQQMVAIGRALLGAPKLLMLDEPSLGLAPVIATAMFQALKEIRQITPLLVVEQNTSLVLQLAERAYVLSNGKIVLDRNAQELSQRGELLGAYLGEESLLTPDIS